MPEKNKLCAILSDDAILAMAKIEGYEPKADDVEMLRYFRDHKLTSDEQIQWIREQQQLNERKKAVNE